MSNFRHNYKCDLHGATTFFTVKELSYKPCGGIAVVVYAFCLLCNLHVEVKEEADEVQAEAQS
jgi:hypothetical protein